MQDTTQKGFRGYVIQWVGRQSTGSVAQHQTYSRTLVIRDYAGRAAKLHLTCLERRRTENIITDSGMLPYPGGAGSHGPDLAALAA